MPRRSAFSLVEVILALAVLSFCLPALLGLVGVGLRGGSQAREETSIAAAAAQLSGELLSRTDAVFPCTNTFDVHGVAVDAGAKEAFLECAVSTNSVPEAELAGIGTNLAVATLSFSWPAAAPAARRQTTRLYVPLSPR